jgi:hypothetical protein
MAFELKSSLDALEEFVRQEQKLAGGQQVDFIGMENTALAWGLIKSNRTHMWAFQLLAPIRNMEMARRFKLWSKILKTF